MVSLLDVIGAAAQISAGMGPIRPPRNTGAQADYRLGAARGRPPIQPLPRAGAFAGKVLRPIAKRFGPTLAELTERWPEIAGERLARMARPMRLTQGRDGGILTLLARGPAATLIQAESSRIIERANFYCGGKVVARLKIQQGPLHDAAAPGRPAPRPAPQGLTPSEADSVARHAAGARSPALRTALERLGRAVLSRPL